MVVDAEVGEVAGEGLAGELGAVVGEDTGELDADVGQAGEDEVDEARGDLGRLVAR